VTGTRLRYRTLRLCASGGGFEAIPDQAFVLDLAGIRARLEASGVEVVDARVMLIVRGTPELTVARAGRILVKANDPRAAQEALDRFCRGAGLSVEFVATPGSRTG
jgi:hypothetical protein